MRLIWEEPAETSSEVGPPELARPGRVPARRRVRSWRLVGVWPATTSHAGAKSLDRVRRPDDRRRRLLGDRQVLAPIPKLRGARRRHRRARLGGELDRRRDARDRAASPAATTARYFQNFEVTTGVEVGDAVRDRRVGAQTAVRAGDASSRSASRPTARCTRAGGVRRLRHQPRPGYDYDDYAGIDVHDKLVLVFTNEPGEMDSTSRFDGSDQHAARRAAHQGDQRPRARRARAAGRERAAHHAGEPLQQPRTDGGGYMTERPARGR